MSAKESLNLAPLLVDFSANNTRFFTCSISCVKKHFLRLTLQIENTFPNWYKIVTLLRRCQPPPPLAVFTMPSPLTWWEDPPTLQEQLWWSPPPPSPAWCCPSCTASAFSRVYWYEKKESVRIALEWNADATHSEIEYNTNGNNSLLYC